jgi:hypothetical protein
MDYRISVRDDFNLRNQLGYIASKSGHNDPWRALGDAITITELAMSLQKETGLGIRVWNSYSDGFSEHYRERGNFRVDVIWNKVLNQPQDPQAKMGEGQVYSDLKRRLGSLQQILGFKDEPPAVAFAVQMVYEMALTIDRCPGKAFVCVTNDIQLRDGAKHIHTPFEKNTKGTIGRIKKWFFG